jgi:hypothetical protein
VCVYIYSMRRIHLRGQENGHQQRNVIEIVECIVGAGQWEGGQMELHKDEFDILAMIKFLSWGLKDLLEQKNIAFNMNIDDLASRLLTSHRVIGDKQRVVQTLGECGCCGCPFRPCT